MSEVTSWSVFILLKCGDKILLVYNKEEEKPDGKVKRAAWGLPGGKVEEDEIHNNEIEEKKALARELREETGIDLNKVRIMKHPDLYLYEDKPDWFEKKKKSRVIVLVGEIKEEIEPQPSLEADVIEGKWFPISEISKLDIYKNHLRRIQVLLNNLNKLQAED